MANDVQREAATIDKIIKQLFEKLRENDDFDEPVLLKLEKLANTGDLKNLKLLEDAIHVLKGDKK